MKEFKMVVNQVVVRPFVAPTMKALPSLEQSFPIRAAVDGLSWKQLGLAVGGVYALLMVLILGSVLLMPNQGVVEPATTTVVEKVGVPTVPSACSESLDSADTALAETARLNVASGEYIRAERSGNKRLVKIALEELRAARAAFSSASTTYAFDRDSCTGTPRGLDISVTQPGL